MMKFHTNLPVSDIKKTAHFYRAVFGSEPAKEKVDYVKFLPEDAAINISFHQVPEGAGGLTKLHLGFELPSLSALNASFARLEAAGLVSSQRETSICCYANQDKFWITDPDGYKWELYVLLEDTDVKIEKNTSCCGGSSTVQSQTSDCC